MKTDGKDESVLLDGLMLSPPGFDMGQEHWAEAAGRPVPHAGPVRRCNAWETMGAQLCPPDPDLSPAAETDPGGASGPVLELRKGLCTRHLIYRGETPILPGSYLMITARFRVMGPERPRQDMPRVRVRGWPGDPCDAHVPGLTETGPAACPDRPGQICTVRAVVGATAGTGVDMAWGTRPVYGHFGLEIIGRGPAVLQIGAVSIEDVTGKIQARRRFEAMRDESRGIRPPRPAAASGHSRDSPARDYPV